jgi:hypothetical protein
LLRCRCAQAEKALIGTNSTKTVPGELRRKWAAELKRRWEKCKFFKLWEKEKKVGRDPLKAFNERGWEP